MQITGQELLPVPRERAWAALNDVEMLKASIAGCESLTPLGGNEFEAQMGLSLGLIKVRFTGRLKLSDLRPPESYRLAFEGGGGAIGHGKGVAQVRLTLESPEQTLLRYEVQLSLEGQVAQMGGRWVEMGARKIAADFFKAFNTRLGEIESNRDS